MGSHMWNPRFFYEREVRLAKDDPLDKPCMRLTYTHHKLASGPVWVSGHIWVSRPLRCLACLPLPQLNT